MWHIQEVSLRFQKRKMKNVKNHFFFLSRTLTTHRTGLEGRGPFFTPLISTHSQTFRHSLATMHVRWLSHIFNRNPCIYQIATWWEFTASWNYHLIDWWCEVSFSFFTWWFDTRFLLQQSWYGKPVDSNSKFPSILGIRSPFYQNQG